MDVLQFLTNSTGLTNALVLLNLLLLMEIEINVKKLFDVHDKKEYTEIAPFSLKALVDTSRKAA